MKIVSNYLSLNIPIALEVYLKLKNRNYQKNSINTSDSYNILFMIKEISIN